jgi:hypothetical protein
MGKEVDSGICLFCTEKNIWRARDGTQAAEHGKRTGTEGGIVQPVCVSIERGN